MRAPLEDLLQAALLMLARPLIKFHTNIMNRLIPLNEIKDFSSIATDMVEHLHRPDNLDVTEEFPATVSRYGVDRDEAIANFEAARELYTIGSREQFIVASGERAVGMCLITNQIDIPEGLNPEAPNISGFIANPFRGAGLGRFSIEARMKVIKKNFHNRAWTFVKDTNLPSDHLVQSVGFRKTDREVEGWEGHHLYLFGDVEN